MSSPAQVNLIVVQPEEPFSKKCYSDLIYVLQISVLVMGTYGLMIGMFALCLTIESLGGSYYTQIPLTFDKGGGILLGLFVLYVTLFGIAWCWGAPKREGLRRSIVENQLALIRAAEQAEEAKDLQEERIMIENRRKNRQ